MFVEPHDEGFARRPHRNAAVRFWTVEIALGTRAGFLLVRKLGNVDLRKLEKEMKTNMTYDNDQVTEAMEVNFA
jgi:hypothetical protein